MKSIKSILFLIPFMFLANTSVTYGQIELIIEKIEVQKTQVFFKEMRLNENKNNLEQKKDTERLKKITKKKAKNSSVKEIGDFREEVKLLREDSIKDIKRMRGMKRRRFA